MKRWAKREKVAKKAACFACRGFSFTTGHLYMAVTAYYDFSDG
ncbi:MAG: hypothetical protein WAM14_09040 [Candidatus Nitrosopolaris sp.]